MRINIKNAVSFEIFPKSFVGNTIDILNGIDRRKFTEDIKYMKAHIVVDFGNFERTLWFDSDMIMENFIGQYLPEDLGYVVITKN
jgi:hypothetical protein